MGGTVVPPSIKKCLGIKGRIIPLSPPYTGCQTQPKSLLCNNMCDGIYIWAGWTQFLTGLDVSCRTLILARPSGPGLQLLHAQRVELQSFSPTRWYTPQDELPESSSSPAGLHSHFLLCALYSTSYFFSVVYRTLQMLPLVEPSLLL